MVIFLGAGFVHAGATVNFDPNDPEKATGIKNLVVNGTLYNVAFSGNDNAASVYGDFPGNFDFTTEEGAAAAVDAIDDALNAAGNAERVGEEGSAGFLLYRVGFESFLAGEIESLTFWEGVSDKNDPVWIRAEEPDVDCYVLCTRIYAKFTEIDPGPDCPADLNGDDSVGFADLQELLQAWGDCPIVGDCPADLNGDDSVGFADLQELLQAWGPCPD